MRKLTVKNFSVIKEAELEFGKITVLIGPQSSGKSLLCKLAFFLTRELVGIATSSILNGDSWEEYLQAVSRDFWSRV
jgi:predicted ATPase